MNLLDTTQIQVSTLINFTDLAPTIGRPEPTEREREEYIFLTTRINALSKIKKPTPEEQKQIKSDERALKRLQQKYPSFHFEVKSNHSSDKT